jgi:hypothetical protein
VGGGGGVTEKTIGMRFSQSWHGAAILLYWKVAQANLIAWRCEEIEARLRWVSVEERTWACAGNLAVRIKCLQTQLNLSFSITVLASRTSR